MGLKNFLKNTKRVNSAGYIGSIKGDFTNNKWFGVSIENNTFVAWSNSSDDIIFKRTDIINCEKTAASLIFIITLKEKGVAEMRFQVKTSEDIFFRFLETGV